ncbi:response regulator [Desulfobacterales bacterium HSG2]|nr:response regulator [Desulfobacterales bacterium HSG2]
MSYLIMVVENSEAISKLMRFRLEQAGHKVITAENGLDALRKMKDVRPDMLFTDLNMPNMDGIELIRQVRTDPRFRFMPIVVVTTESRDSEKRNDVKAAGASGWITKPFGSEQLLKAVRKLLG